MYVQYFRPLNIKTYFKDQLLQDKEKNRTEINKCGKGEEYSTSGRTHNRS